MLRRCPSAVDRLPDAARILGYLASTGDFGALAVRALVADVAKQIAASAKQFPDQFEAPRHELDARQALEYMRDALDEVANYQLSDP